MRAALLRLLTAAYGTSETFPNVRATVAIRGIADSSQRATTTIPIVFIFVPDPVAVKLVRSLAHPGGNITGLSQLAFDMSAKRVELLKEMVPRVFRG
jgi:putative ABC transport system substrate-binding protein